MFAYLSNMCMLAPSSYTPELHPHAKIAVWNNHGMIMVIKQGQCLTEKWSSQSDRCLWRARVSPVWGLYTESASKAEGVLKKRGVRGSWVLYCTLLVGRPIYTHSHSLYILILMFTAIDHSLCLSPWKSSKPRYISDYQPDVLMPEVMKALNILFCLT